MTDPDHLPPAPAPEVRSLALVVSRDATDAALGEALWANRNFNLTATALQRRLDRLGQYKGERGKVFGARARNAVKALKEHTTGGPYQRYLVACSQIRDAMTAGGPLPAAVVDCVLDFGKSSSRLYIAAEDAANEKKAEMRRLTDKIDTVQAALKKHLRQGPGGHDVDEESAQTTLPGVEQPAAEPWMDAQTRQVTFDTLHSEIRVIDRDLTAATAANDTARAKKAEAAKQTYVDLIESLKAAQLLDGLTPDDEDEFVETVTEHEGEPDIELAHDEDPLPARAGPVEGPGFTLQPDGPAAGLEDPTKHPALQPAIAGAASKRAAKKAKAESEPAAKKTSKRGAKQGR